MSVEQMGCVWKLDLAPNKKLVLLAYADHAWDDGTHVYPSLARVAHKTGYSRDQVKRITRDLVADGLIEKVKEANSHCKQPATYKLTLSNGAPLPEFQGRNTGGKLHPVPPSPPGANDPSPLGAPMHPKPSIEPSHKDRGASTTTSIHLKVVDDCLALLAELDGYPQEEERNVEHLQKLCERHGTKVDIRHEVKKFVYHYEEQGFAKKQKPRARLSTWIANAEEWSQPKKATAKPSPDCVISALEFYESDGDTYLRRFAVLAREYDFTLDEVPPWQIANQLGGDKEEQSRNLRRIRSVADRAVREAS